MSYGRGGAGGGQREVMPLLPTNMANQKLVVKREADLWIDNDEEDDKVLFADSKKRGTSLVFADSAILILQVIQLYCVLHSISLRWTWPENWVIYTRFILLVNLDLWDFMKLQGNGTYLSIQGYHTPSADLSITYWHLLLVWGIIIFIGLLVYIIVYAAIRSTHHPYLPVRVAKLQRVYLILFQVLAIPFGTVTGRVFHCNNDNVVDIDNVLKCYQDHHWAYISPVFALAVLLYIVLPVWMIAQTRGELLSMPSDRHEAYLQLKETEYVHGMDVGYIVGHFNLFASFKKFGAYYRPSVHLCFLVIIGFFAGAHSHMQIQAISLCVIFFLMFLGFIIVRPFRLACFNALLVFSYLMLTLDAMLGALLSSSTVTTATTVWVTPTYLTYALGAINGVWLGVIVIFLIYVISRQVACCKKCIACCRVPLWPALTSSRIHTLTPDTHKYVRAILKTRITLEKILEMPPLFAPAHEIGRQIHIINAYCREAEFTGDPMLNSLWDLLDELIDSHARIAPKSLFAESVKDSIRSTAAELMRMMPAFTRRLAQREYDFLLTRPVKRRLLLKMYCMSLFLNKRRTKVTRSRLQEPYLTRVWKQPRDKLEPEELPDDGYYEDMYPEYESSVNPQVYRPETSVGLDLMGFDDEEMEGGDSRGGKGKSPPESSDKEELILPLSRGGITTAHAYTNLVFEGDNLSDISSVGEPDSPKPTYSLSFEKSIPQADRFSKKIDDDHIYSKSVLSTRIQSQSTIESSHRKEEMVLSQSHDNQISGEIDERNDYDADQNQKASENESTKINGQNQTELKTQLESNNQREVASPGIDEVAIKPVDVSTPRTEAGSGTGAHKVKDCGTSGEATSHNPTEEDTNKQAFGSRVTLISVAEANTEENNDKGQDEAPKDFAV